ncbi:MULTISPECIES: hypothetical protein [unclassified Brevundimonas]|uniref:hypothetical protein n=1 Tax=unclassified Brevundimonas TaxID=2622653 RepID=UPI0025C467D5|nr:MULTISPECIES: hypothetical protein [unclassified Brevundimonas]
MNALSPLVFVPASMHSGAIVERLQALAAEQCLTAEFVAEKATDALVAAPTADVCIYQDIDFDLLHPDARWSVVLPRSMQDLIAIHKLLQPDQPDHWALTHGSGAAAGVYWLREHGAATIRFDDLPPAESDFDLSASTAELERLYVQWPLEPGQSWDWRAPLIATSPAYTPDHEGWVNLTGRARHILAGPFIFLMPGIWKIELDLDVDVETGVPRLAFQWGGAALEKTLFTTLLRKSGRYQVSLEAKITRPDAAHCMVATDAAQLQGFLRLRDMKLTYLSAL